MKKWTVLSVLVVGVIAGWFLASLQMKGLMNSSNEVYKYLLEQKKMELEAVQKKVEHHQALSKEWKEKADAYWTSMLEFEKDYTYSVQELEAIKKKLEKLTDVEIVNELRRLLKLAEVELWLTQQGINFTLTGARVNTEALYEWDNYKTKQIPSLTFSLAEAKKTVEALQKSLSEATTTIETLSPVVEKHKILITDFEALLQKYDQRVMQGKIEKTILLILGLLVIIK